MEKWRKQNLREKEAIDSIDARLKELQDELFEKIDRIAHLEAERRRLKARNDKLEKSNAELNLKLYEILGLGLPPEPTRSCSESETDESENPY